MTRTRAARRVDHFALELAPLGSLFAEPGDSTNSVAGMPLRPASSMIPEHSAAR